MKQILLANLTLMVPVLAWGLPVPFMDTLFDRWDPVLASVIRYGIGLPSVLLIWLALRRRGTRLWPQGLRFWPLMRLSFFGLVGFTLSYSYALDYMHPVTAAVLSATAPVISAAVATLMFRHPLADGFKLAILLSIVGGVLTAVDFEGGTSLEFRGGEALFVLSGAVWAWYSLEAQRLMPGLPQVQVTLLTVFPVFFMMPVVYGLFLLLGLAHLPPPREEILALDLWILAWFGVVGIALAMACWNQGVKQAGVVVASLYLNLVPITAILTAIAVGIEPRPLQILGGLIVLAGVVQAQLRLLRLRRAGTVAPPRETAET